MMRQITITLPSIGALGSIGDAVLRAFRLGRGPSRSLRTAGRVLRPESDERTVICALLLEVAHADGSFSEAERRLVEATVHGQFGMGEGEGEDLLRAAEELRASTRDLGPLTYGIGERYSRGQRALLAGLVDELVQVDGKAERPEVYLLRRIRALLDVEPVSA